MKKVLFLLTMVLTISANSFGQSEVSQGSIIIDPYIGTLQSNILRSEPSFTTGSTVSNWKLNGSHFGYGVRFEYLLADKFGLGFDFNYVKSGSNYDVTSQDSVYNGSTNSWTVQSNTFNWDYTSVRIRAMLRMNYHFVQSDRVDAYTGFAVGYKHAKRTWTIEDPNAETDGLEQERALIPVAVRLALGTRIYFTENIGAMIELGAGGGQPIQVGLSVKL